MLNKEKCTIFDKKDVYDREIAPLVAQIKKICKLNDIPMIFTFAVANDEKDTTYVTEGSSTGSMNINLTDDCFENYLVALQKGKKIMLVDANTLDPEQLAYISDYATQQQLDSPDLMQAIAFDGDL